jgi:periplasmic mercuric ion binding protein
MKTIKLVMTAILAVVLGVNVFGQTQGYHNASATKTETFKVNGNCDQCKARIEKAAKVGGVSKAEWNTESKILTLTYDPAKVKSEDVQKKIAAAGHDTEKVKATDVAYSKLPECCQYPRK